MVKPIPCPVASPSPPLGASNSNVLSGTTLTCEQSSVEVAGQVPFERPFRLTARLALLYPGAVAIRVAEYTPGVSPVASTSTLTGMPAVVTVLEPAKIELIQPGRSSRATVKFGLPKLLRRVVLLESVLAPSSRLNERDLVPNVRTGAGRDVVVTTKLSNVCTAGPALASRLPAEPK